MKITPLTIIKGVVGTTVGLVGLSVIFGSFYTIDSGERGVVLRNGEAVAEVDAGLHWKIPVIDEVARITIQDQVAIYNYDDVYSNDQQPANMTVSVNYRILPGSMITVYNRFGGQQGLVDRIITRRANSRTKEVFSRFDAVTAIQERGRLNVEVEEAIQEAVTSDLLIVDNVQVEGVDFSDAYERSIEERMLAEVAVQREQQNLERERVQAEIRVTQATAAAEAVRLQGQAEADAIDARGQALRDNPDLVALVQAERWNGVLPTTMIPSGTLPIIEAAK